MRERAAAKPRGRVDNSIARPDRSDAFPCELPALVAQRREPSEPSRFVVQQQGVGFRGKVLVEARTVHALEVLRKKRAHGRALVILQGRDRPQIRMVFHSNATSR